MSEERAVQQVLARYVRGTDANFLDFIGDFAYFLNLAERGGFEPPIPVLPG